MHTISSLRKSLRKLIVTGFIFIMPVLISIVVLARFWKHLLRIGGLLSRLMRIDTVLGPSGDAVVAVLFFLAVCLLASRLPRLRTCLSRPSVRGRGSASG